MLGLSFPHASLRVRFIVVDSVRFGDGVKVETRCRFQGHDTPEESSHMLELEFVF